MHLSQQVEEIERAVLEMIEQRDGSVCPSEVARRLDEKNWRARMEQVREVARGLARSGALVITRGEETLDPDQPFGGPIRLRRPD